MPAHKSDDPVINKHVGLNTSLWPKVEAAAKRAGMSRSAWIAMIVRRALGLKVVDAPDTEAQAACEHANTTSHGWGKTCDDCKKRLS